MNGLDKYFILFFIIILNYKCFGQTNSYPAGNQNDIEVIAKSYGDSIVLRWAPGKPFVWELGNQYGYSVTRITIGNDSALQLTNTIRKNLTPQPIQPDPLPQWEQVAFENNNAALAVQAIYGESMEFTNRSDQMGGLVNKARTLENKFSLALFAADQSAKVANLHGLRLVDKNIREGYKYLYRIKLAGSENIKVDSGYVYQAVNDTFPIPRPRGLQANFGHKKVELRWNKRDFRQIFSSYQVEKSIGGGNRFEVVNDLPFINPGKGPQNSPKYMYFTDSLPDTNQEYVYRIRGRTPFGELSPPSDIVRGKSKTPNFAWSPVITKKEVLDDYRVKIYWETQNPDHLHSDGFEILRSNKASGNYVVANEDPIGPETYSFVDNAPLPTNYYRIKVLGSENRQATSLPVMVQLPDSIPPLPPEGLTGHIDTTGMVMLHWQPNTEQDLSGYRVLRANTPDSEFMQVSNSMVKGEIYRDTIAIKTLSKNIYYRIIAVDKHFNRSSMSKVLKLNRPDLVPPSSPAFTGIQNNDSSIVLQWQPSSSKDVKRQLLYKKRPFQSSWYLIGDLPAGDQKFEDNMVNTGRDYQYRLIAVDSAGMESKNSLIITAAAIDNGMRSPVQNFFSKINRKTKKIELAWVYKKTNVERFLIYRNQPDQPLRILKAISGSRSRYTDQQLTVNSEYGYRIQAVFADGGKSPVSKLLKVKY